MAILGCGGMAADHAQRYAVHPDVEIVGLCDVSPKGLDAFIELNLKGYEPRPQTFTDATQMYAETRPDAVTIVTPHTLHYDHAIQALNAGCHILMEKPMVTDSEQAHALAAAASASGKLFLIGYNTPCTAAINYIRETIRSGALGKLELVSGWLSQEWKRVSTGTWRQDAALSGGGAMYDTGAHLFNTLVWTVEQPVEVVHAFIDNLDAPVDINGTANLRFANGVLATLAIGGNCPPSGSYLTYMFDGGRIDCNGWFGNWIKVYKGKEELTELHLDDSQAPVENFVDAILGRAEPRTSVLNGVIQSEIMDAIYESARTGQVARPVKR
jgi:predicted dehydrogenase